MSLKIISKSVEAALYDPESLKYIDAYLSALKDNLQKTEDSLKSALVILFFLISVFELLTRAAISEVSLGPFKLSDFSLVYRLLPVVIAYCYYEMFSVLSMRRLSLLTFHTIMGKVHKSISDNDLDYFLLPPATFRMEELLSRRSSGKLAGAIEAISSPLMLFVLAAPLVFLVYSYYRCFMVFGFKDILVYTSLLFSILFSLQSILFGIQTNRLAE